MANHDQRTLDSVFCGQRRPLLRTIARVVGNPAVAEDLVQETYLRVRTALRERRVDHVQPFLYQTARNLAFDHLRAERRRGALIDGRIRPDEAIQVAAPAPSQEATARDQELLRHLERVLQELTRRQRTVFLLAKLHGRGQDAIAAELGVSKSTVQKDLKAAMAACIAAFDRLDPP